jgi:hypothetical protein
MLPVGMRQGVALFVYPQVSRFFAAGWAKAAFTAECDMFSM